MPLVEVTLMEGRDPEAIRSLIDRVHHAVVESVGADPAGVRVIIREVPAAHWAAGNVTLAERYAAAPPSAATTENDE
jgi:4-oxalocrotonate tautomerase